MKDERLKVNATLSPWEENMIVELAQKFNINENIILEIGSTFLSNELIATKEGKPTLLSMISMAITKNDMNIKEHENG